MTALSKDQQLGVLEVTKTVENDGEVMINEDETVKRTADWKVGVKVSRQELRVETDCHPCGPWHSTSAA
jgi:hypothetical protein